MAAICEVRDLSQQQQTATKQQTIVSLSLSLYYIPHTYTYISQPYRYLLLYTTHTLRKNETK